MDYEHWRHYARGWLLHVFGREDAAFAAYSEAFRHNPHDVQSARHLAAIAASQQRFEVAEQWLMTATTLVPEDSALWFNLGYVREQGGHPQAAVEAFARSTQINPNQDRAWYGKGLAHARLGQHEDAVAALREAIRLQPMNGEAYYQLGMALHHARRPEELGAVVKQLVGFEPKRARKLVQDSQRSDLMTLIPDLPF